MNGFLSYRRACGSILGGLLIIVTLYGCGGSGGGETSSSQGALTFKLSLANSPAQQTFALSAERELSEFSCGEGEWATKTIEVEVIQNETTVRSGRFDCEAHHGTIRNVPAGSNLKLDVFARDEEDTAIFHGSVKGITVVGGGTTDAGIVALHQITDRAPILGPIGNHSVDENQVLTIDISAWDPDDEDTLVFTAFQILENGETADLPTGADITHKAKGTASFQWQTDYGDSGIYKILFKVEDGSTLDRGPLSDSELITISVGNVNQTPTLRPIGNKSVTLVYDYDCDCYTAELKFTITASDPDELDELTITAEKMPKYAVLSPTVYHVDCNCWAATFTWRPENSETRNDVGAHKVTFKASDNGTPSIEVSEKITITVEIEELE